MSASDSTLRAGRSVEAEWCPGHRWAEEDHTPPGMRDPDGDWQLVVCVHCRGVRCEKVVDGRRCTDIRWHFRRPHRFVHEAAAAA